MSEKENKFDKYAWPWYEMVTQRRDLVYRYNNTHPADVETRYNILKELLGSIKGRCIIEQPFRCDHGHHIHVGNNFYANYNLVVLDSTTITIGDNVAIGPNVTIVTCDHSIHPDTREGDHGYPITSAPITIEDDVWIGAGVTILKGVTIGRGSVIGAHSVVNRDIPPMSVAAGIPCKVIREITEEDKIFWREEEL